MAQSTDMQPVVVRHAYKRQPEARSRQPGTDVGSIAERHREALSATRGRDTRHTMTA